MKDKIQSLLERELLKIEVLSLTNPKPLQVADIKSLDTLIKAYRSFVEPKPAESAPASTPASMPDDQLVKDILGDQAQRSAE